MACQAFDVDYAKITAVDAEFIFENIPWFDEDSVAKAEFRLYLSVLHELTVFNNIVDFWLAATKRFPKLSQIALSSLSIPVNSVAAERSFSLYSSVLRDNPRSIAVKNLLSYNSLYQNSGVM